MIYDYTYKREHGPLVVAQKRRAGYMTTRVFTPCTKTYYLTLHNIKQLRMCWIQ